MNSINQNPVNQTRQPQLSLEILDAAVDKHCTALYVETYPCLIRRSFGAYGGVMTLHSDMVIGKGQYVIEALEQCSGFFAFSSEKNALNFLKCLSYR